MERLDGKWEEPVSHECRVIPVKSLGYSSDGGGQTRPEHWMWNLG